MYWSMGNQYFAIFESNGALRIFRVGIAIEIPTGIDESVHRVGLAPRRPAAFGAGDVDELRHAAQRRAALLGNLDLRGQHDRQLIVGHLHQAVLFAVNHGDGRAPVALTAHAPIFQAIGDGCFAELLFDGNLLKFFLRFFATQAVVFAGIHEYAVMRDKRQLRCLQRFRLA